MSKLTDANQARGGFYSVMMRKMLEQLVFAYQMTISTMRERVQNSGKKTDTKQLCNFPFSVWNPLFNG